MAQEVEENPLLKNLIPVPVGGGGAGGAVDPPKARHKTDAPPTLSNGQSHMPPSKKATVSGCSKEMCVYFIWRQQLPQNNLFVQLCLKLLQLVANFSSIP